MFGYRQPALRSPLFGSHKMYGMVFVEESCSVNENICSNNNGNCSAQSICFLNNEHPLGRVCKCNDEHTCNDYEIDDLTH